MKCLLILGLLIHQTSYAFRWEETPAESQPIQWALKTNALYDLALTPNIGVEIGFNRRWSISTNFMCAWWDNDAKHRYWRICGGDVEARYWLPLRGHHVGVYTQLVTYDFEFGKRGYMADKWNFGGGLTYGYAHKLNQHLRLDFNLGIGFLGGKYKEYLPIDQCYVWQETKQRRWVGPTKVEISLVWLLNPQKGGKR